MNERLVTVEEPVAPGQEVPFEPALALMLREHFDNPTVGRQMVITGPDRGLPDAVGHFEDVLEPVGGGLIRTEDPEIRRIGRCDVAQPRPENSGRFP